jgi:glycosyltransferase involved in cell wall biosynthesis
MRILMIAPEPFFEPRGTPFSEYHRIRALSDLGHEVDLVTYPFGKDVSLPGLRIFRCARPPFVRGVRIGPSLPKVLLDLSLAVAACGRALRSRYDAVHSHEEGTAVGVLLSSLLGVPHTYDMHSSLPQQLTNFAYSRSRVLHWMLSALERVAVRRSKVVIVICPQLGDTVRKIDPRARPILIENAPGSGDPPEQGSGAAVRRTLGMEDATPLVLYTGTFEAYQGLDLLFAAAAIARQQRPDLRLVLAGGKPAQVEKARRQAEALGAGAVVQFVGERPADEIPKFLDAADVLVSPRSTGTNTPLKIYQYLRAGRPIVATRLLTHTQVLSDEVAILTEPTAEAFASGILRAINNPEEASRVGRAAQHLAETRYTYESYLERTREVCALLFTAASAQVAAGGAA